MSLIWSLYGVLYGAFMESYINTLVLDNDDIATIVRALRGHGA